MVHYDNDNNAYCSAINAQKFEIREHNTIYGLLKQYYNLTGIIATICI